MHPTVSPRLQLVYNSSTTRLSVIPNHHPQLMAGGESMDPARDGRGYSVGPGMAGAVESGAVGPDGEACYVLDEATRSTITLKF